MWISFAMLCTRPLLTTSRAQESYLLSKQPAYPLKHAVLLRVVRVVLGRDLKQRGESGCVRLDAMSYLLGNLQSHVSTSSPSAAFDKTYMLVDQEDSDVLALRGEAVECRLDGTVLCFGVYNKEVLLGVRRLRHVLYRVSLVVQS